MYPLCIKYIKHNFIYIVCTLASSSLSDKNFVFFSYYTHIYVYAYIRYIYIIHVCTYVSFKYVRRPMWAREVHLTLIGPKNTTSARREKTKKMVPCPRTTACHGRGCHEPRNAISHTLIRTYTPAGKIYIWIKLVFIIIFFRIYSFWGPHNLRLLPGE